MDEEDKASIEKYELGIQTNICSECHMGYYNPHPQLPHKYKKCGTCGHTKEIINSSNSRMPCANSD